MAIPKIDLPTYKVRLESLGKDIVFRPFVVKEEKILLMALESLDYDTSIEAIKQIIRNCVLDEIDVDKLPLFEIEFLFLNLRARSIGEVVSLEYICENVSEENKVCKTKMKMEVDLLKVALDHKPVDNMIQLTNDVGIKIMYPTMSMSRSLIDKFNSKDAPIEILKECTEYLYDDSQVYKLSEMQEGEFEEFVNNLTTEQFKKIKKFFSDMPVLRHKSVLVCGKCGKNHTIRLEGLLDFFV
jgi:hypothetical protein